MTFDSIAILNPGELFQEHGSVWGTSIPIEGKLHNYRSETIDRQFIGISKALRVFTISRCSYNISDRGRSQERERTFVRPVQRIQ
jgi:hypothetical protein